jgi:hypothetical protein
MPPAQVTALLNEWSPKLYEKKSTAVAKTE